MEHLWGTILKKVNRRRRRHHKLLAPGSANVNSKPKSLGSKQREVEIATDGEKIIIKVTWYF